MSENRKFYLQGYMPSLEKETIDDYEKMIERVRYLRESGYTVSVIWGELLEFEPVEIVKSWKVKGWD